MEAKSQDERYLEAAATYGAALHRLASAYEADPDKRRDLLQDLHVALWRSLASFDGRCSLRTWVYRVAHNAATTYVIGQRRSRTSAWLSLDEVAAVEGCALGTVKSRIHRAREQLRAALAEEEA